MPLFIINDDITKLKVDAIVNAANNSLLGGGGVDGCIHRVAGSELLEECKTLHGCETGDAKITKGYKLPAKYVIHTVGPVWRGGKNGEERLLTSCYNRCLQIAIRNKCESIAFPMISTGVYGYPKYEAMQIAQKTINKFLEELDYDIDVYIVLFGRDVSGYFDIDDGLKDYFISRMSGLHPYMSSGTLCGVGAVLKSFVSGFSGQVKEKVSHEQCREEMPKLKEVLNQPRESFSSMVMRKIKELGLNEVSCYKAANVNKQIFSKIRSSAFESDTDSYQPTKITAMSFALALKLNIEESRDLLGKAGFAFSNNKTDIIVEYCISNHINDIFRVNEILFSYNQPILGSKCL